MTAALRSAPGASGAAGDAPADERFIPALDGIRGIAIIVVVIHNARIAAGALDALPLKLYALAANAGWVGVQLFFALSGFLITGILLRTRGSQGYFSRFYVRRSLRIFPLYYTVLALAFLALATVPTLRSAGNGGGIPAVLYWTYLANWEMPYALGIHFLGHFWSLAVEEQFYLLWPAVVLLLGERRLLRACGAIAVLSLASRIVLVSGTVVPPRVGLGASYFWTSSRCDALLLGAAGAVLLRRYGDAEPLPRWLVRAVAGACAALLAVLVLARGLSAMDPLALTLGQALTALASAAWVVYAARPASKGGASERVLSLPWLRAIGKYSYAIYVFHVPVAWLAARAVGARLAGEPWALRLAAQIGYAAGVFALAFVLSLGSWRLIEQPFLRLKRRFPRGDVAVARESAPA